MKHPFAFIQPHRRGRYFFPLLALTLLLMILMNYIGQPLRTIAAPSGIISFEFAANSEQANAIMASWSAEARVRAAFVQGLDFLFPFVYSSTVSLACVWAAGVLHSVRWPFAHLGIPLAWGQWLAASFDFLENIALVLILFGQIKSPWPQIAALSATIKFALLFVGMIYAFYGLAARVTLPTRTTPSAT